MARIEHTTRGERDRFVQHGDIPDVIGSTRTAPRRDRRYVASLKPRCALDVARTRVGHGKFEAVDSARRNISCGGERASAASSPSWVGCRIRAATYRRAATIGPCQFGIVARGD